MSDEDDPGRADRSEPVGEPVVRGDPEITGPRAERAVRFDPGDPESLAEATDVVREFAAGDAGDHVDVLRAAAACAALVRGEGSYRDAADRADVTVDFLRTWTRVHDLPISIRRHVAAGDIAPSAAKHVARVTGDARFLLAWAVLDADLAVDEVRAVAGDVSDGTPVERALAERDVTLGRVDVTLPTDRYREFRRRVGLRNEDPGPALAAILRDWLEE